VYEKEREYESNRERVRKGSKEGKCVCVCVYVKEWRGEGVRDELLVFSYFNLSGFLNQTEK